MYRQQLVDPSYIQPDVTAIVVVAGVQKVCGQLQKLSHVVITVQLERYGSRAVSSTDPVYRVGVLHGGEVCGLEQLQVMHERPGI
jgi:hypothetical protein